MLVVFCTVAAFLIYATLVREVGPGRAAVITYVAPIVALGLGVVVLDEHPGAGALAGLALILAGSWIATRTARRAGRRARRCLTPAGCRSRGARGARGWSARRSASRGTIAAALAPSPWSIVCGVLAALGTIGAFVAFVVITVLEDR